MKEIEVSGKKRTAVGKKATRILREQGYVPCNVYGEKKDEKGNPVALPFACLAKDLRKIVYTPHIYVINLLIDGESHKAIIKETQFHPVTDAILHMDFYEVNDTKPITIGVPIQLKGLAQGVRDGGRINLSIRKINVNAPYQSIPERLEIDVTNLRLGKSIKVGELKFEGLTFVTSPEVVVCSVKTTRASKSASAAASEEEESATTEAAPQA